MLIHEKQLHEVCASVCCAKSEAGISESIFFWGHELMLLC